MKGNQNTDVHFSCYRCSIGLQRKFSNVLGENALQVASFSHSSHLIVVSNIKLNTSNTGMQWEGVINIVSKVHLQNKLQNSGT